MIYHSFYFLKKKQAMFCIPSVSFAIINGYKPNQFKRRFKLGLKRNIKHAEN